MFISTLFIIHSSIHLFLFSKFLMMKVKQWKPMAYAKYRMKYDHVVE